MKRSINIFDHYRVEILIRYLAILVRVSLLQHQQQSFSVQIFLDVAVDFLEIVNCQVVFVVPIVLLKNCSDLFFLLVSVRFSIHGLHELNETNTTGLLSIELCNNLVSGLSVRLKSVLSQQQFDIVGKQDSHTCRVISIEYFFQIDDVLIAKSSRDIESWFKISEIFTLETYSIDISSVDFRLAFVRTIAEFLGRRSGIGISFAFVGAAPTSESH